MSAGVWCGLHCRLNTGTVCVAVTLQLHYAAVCGLRRCTHRPTCLCLCDNKTVDVLVIFIHHQQQIATEMVHKKLKCLI